MWEQVERAELKRRGRPGNGDRAADPLPQPSLPAGTDRLPQIKHIVVLMMENHSYVNYLGMMSGHGDGLALGANGQPTSANETTDGRSAPLSHSSAPRQVLGVPTQSWHASHIQWNGGANDGFVRSIEETLPG